MGLFLMIRHSYHTPFLGVVVVMVVVSGARPPLQQRTFYTIFHTLLLLEWEIEDTGIIS